MRAEHFDHARSTGDYVVVVPRIADILSCTLRAAYATDPAACEQFADLIGQLDTIKVIPIRR
jgi:hypothetical protein